MIYTVAGALPMASAILLMPFYGKLPADVYGSLSIYFGFSLLVQILVTYSFDASIYLNFHEHKHDTKSLAVFVSSAFVFILMLSAAVGLLLALLGNFIFDRVYGVGQIPFLPFGVLSVATGIFQALFKVNNSLLQTQGKATTFLWLNLLSFSLIAGLTILGLIVFPNTLWGPIAGKLIGALIAASWVLGSIFRQFGFHFSWQSLKPTFEFNNSSLIYQIQQWFINYYDR
ncbi:MAG: oligosaccharide flippase family protein, partial [Bacteroidota bacterium]